MKKKSTKKLDPTFQPTKVSLLVAVIASVSLVLFALLSIRLA